MGYSKGASIDDFHGVYLALLPEGTIWHVLCANTGKKTLHQVLIEKILSRSKVQLRLGLAFALQK